MIPLQKGFYDTKGRKVPVEIVRAVRLNPGMASALWLAVLLAQGVDDQVDALLRAFELEQEFEERALLELAVRLSGLGASAADPIVRRLQEDLDDGEPSPEAPALLRALSGRDEEAMMIEGLRLRAGVADPAERRRLMTLLGEAGTPEALALLDELVQAEPRTLPVARPFRFTEEPRVTIKTDPPAEPAGASPARGPAAGENPENAPGEGSLAYNIILGTLGAGIVLLLLSFLRKGSGR